MVGAAAAAVTGGGGAIATAFAMASASLACCLAIFFAEYEPPVTRSAMPPPIFFPADPMVLFVLFLCDAYEFVVVCVGFFVLWVAWVDECVVVFVCGVFDDVVGFFCGGCLCGAWVVCSCEWFLSECLGDGVEEAGSLGVFEGGEVFGFES